mmetsp:Transcript_123203/g.192438  ORF Transcript_123203/g.192438 Transcript_123203/m.192438 type:complete len:190 (-) Transcript_123203:43-612(-)
MDLAGRWSWLGFSPIPVVPVTETCFYSLASRTPHQNKLRRYRRFIEERSAKRSSCSAYKAEARLPPPSRRTPTPTPAFSLQNLRQQERLRLFDPRKLRKANAVTSSCAFSQMVVDPGLSVGQSLQTNESIPNEKLESSVHRPAGRQHTGSWASDSFLAESIDAPNGEDVPAPCWQTLPGEIHTAADSVV